MNRVQVVYLHICVALVAVSGTVFAWMKYAMKGNDELAVVNHPLQPWMLAAHVVAAPLLVFGFGWITSGHIWPGFRQKGGPNRRSGAAVMWMIVPMTLSGYLLQVSVADTARKSAAAAHWVTSAVFVLAYAVHLARRQGFLLSRDRSGQTVALESRAGELRAVLPSEVRRSRRKEPSRPGVKGL